MASRSLSVAAIVEFALLLRSLASRLDGLDGSELASSLARTIIASFLMGEVILLWLALLHFGGLLDLAQKLDAGLAVVGGVGIGTVVFFFASRLLRSPEANLLARRLPLPSILRPATR